MFKRSFTVKNRVGKAVKPAKRTYRDKAKEKMEESLDSPPMGRYTYHTTLYIEIMTYLS